MSSRNPVLRNIKAPVVTDEELARIVNGGQLAGQATLVDVITNTAKIFGLVTIGAAYGWITAETNPTLALIAFGVAFVLSLVNILRSKFPLRWYCSTAQLKASHLVPLVDTSITLMARV